MLCKSCKKLIGFHVCVGNNGEEQLCEECWKRKNNSKPLSLGDTGMSMKYLLVSEVVSDNDIVSSLIFINDGLIFFKWTKSGEKSAMGFKVVHSVGSKASWKVKEIFECETDCKLVYKFLEGIGIKNLKYISGGEDNGTNNDT